MTSGLVVPVVVLPVSFCFTFWAPFGFTSLVWHSAHFNNQCKQTRGENLQEQIIHSSVLHPLTVACSVSSEGQGELQPPSELILLQSFNKCQKIGEWRRRRKHHTGDHFILTRLTPRMSVIGVRAFETGQQRYCNLILQPDFWIFGRALFYHQCCWFWNYRKSGVYTHAVRFDLSCYVYNQWLVRLCVHDKSPCSHCTHTHTCCRLPENDCDCQCLTGRPDCCMWFVCMWCVCAGPAVRCIHQQSAASIGITLFLAVDLQSRCCSFWTHTHTQSRYFGLTCSLWVCLTWRLFPSSSSTLLSACDKPSQAQNAKLQQKEAVFHLTLF